MAILAWLLYPGRMWRARRDTRRLESGGITPLELKYGLAHYDAMVADPSVTSDFRTWVAQQETD